LSLRTAPTGIVPREYMRSQITLGTAPSVQDIPSEELRWGNLDFHPPLDPRKMKHTTANPTRLHGRPRPHDIIADEAFVVILSDIFMYGSAET
jgi:hypothetical protein